ncbi:MAG: urea ABC transporter permease subunit UrtC [Deltaproteobacteria bacterium]|jgi:urea transport system permease protein|nr:urea ABC transporter permease subunit UrtC [Deltaproteobacteria bacterium]
MRIFDRSLTIFTLVMAVGAGTIIIGFLAFGTPIFSQFTVGLLGKYLCFAILALAIDLVWGYMGVLSLGHGAFFALGGYAFGMYLMRQIGAQGVYGDAVLPDFMVFIGFETLPWYWRGSQHFLVAVLLVILAPGLLALVFGWTAFRSRVSGVYFSIISQALTYALSLAFYLNALGFGGNNGFTDFKTILGYDVQEKGMTAALFGASALLLWLAVLSSRYLLRSRLGLAVLAIRDNEARVRFAGYKVENVQVAVFTFSAIIAGLGGALYVPQAGIINPSVFAPIFSIEMVACVALGGRGFMYGAIIGAFVVNYAKSRLSTEAPDLWPFILGFLFILTTVFGQGGVFALGRFIWPRKVKADPFKTVKEEPHKGVG